MSVKGTVLKTNGNFPHGTVDGYTNRKCRCDDCRRAWAKEQAGRYRTVYFSDSYQVSVDEESSRRIDRIAERLGTKSKRQTILACIDLVYEMTS